MRLMKCVLAVWMACLSTSSFAQGVQTGTLRGTVQDQQGLPVAGAVISISSPALQASRSATTENDGLYAFRALPPGDYAVRIERPSFEATTVTVTVPLGLDVERNVTLNVAGTQQVVQVVADAPALAATIVGMNIRHNDVEALAMSRTLPGIAELSPGLTSVTPNRDQVSINGALSFDSIFMINGVDVNDNLLGAAQSLFVEDAIAEVQTLTAGIPAEYGRFSGGVVNAITRSGGNLFSGGFRLNLTNPTWSTETPFEVTRGVTHVDNLNKSYEGTLGGPIATNRLWFFSAMRWEDLVTAQAFPQTGIANTQTDKNRRGEIKLTASVASNTTVQGGYLNNNTEYQNRPSIPSFSIDPATIADASVPNWYSFVNYRGVLDSNTLAEAQFSRRKWTRVAGGTNTSLVESPFLALSVPAQYNAPYFDAADPEGRNNVQLTANLTRMMRGQSGRHEVKGGTEWFRSQRTGGGSQSATNAVFHADYLTNDDGLPLYDTSGRLIPMFVPGETLVENYLPQRNVVLNVDTFSLYGQDHWTISPRLSADLGVRFEHVGTDATGGIVGIKTSTIVPRLAAAYDVSGAGKYVAHISYAHYAGRYDEAQVGLNTNVGNADETFAIYTGPAGQGRNFAQGFNLSRYQTVAGYFPTANVSIAPGTTSPLTKEFSAAFGAELSRGYVEATYVLRRTSNLIEDFIDISNGVTNVVKGGVDFGTFTNVVIANSDVASRAYQGMLFQGRYNLRRNWSLNGHYTLMVENDGNYQGESANMPGQTSIIGDYSAAFTAARNFPTGRLQNFQRHKLRLWSIYSIDGGRTGDVSFSGLWRVNSGLVYSLAALGQPLTAIQESRIANYPDSPANGQPIFFGDLGSETFKGYGVLDATVTYGVPVFRSLRPWIKLDVFNLFDNNKQIAWNTTVVPDPTSPRDSLGLPTGYRQGAAFGTATSNAQFPASLPGVTGGRTLRLAFGFRF